MRKLAMVAAAACMWSQTALADWIKAETDNFIVYSVLKKKETKEFLQNLEQYRNYLLRITKAPPEGDTLRLRIFVAKNDRKYDALVDVPGTAGVHSNTRLGPTAAIYFTDDDDPGRGRKGSINRLEKNIVWQTGEQVLFHEFVHNMQYQGPPAYFPLWYQEGFAEFLSSVMFQDDTMYFGKVLKGRAAGLQQHFRWVSAKELLERKRYGFKGGMFYAQAWLLTHMLYTHKDFQHGVGNFIKLVQHEVHPEEALQYVYNIGYEELDDRLHQYFREGNFGVLGTPVDKNFKAKIRVTKLDEREQELVDQEVVARFPHTKSRMRKLASRAEKAAKKYGESPEFTRNQVIGLAVAEDWEEAFQVAEEGLKRFPNSDYAKATLGKLLIGSEVYARDEAEAEAREEDDAGEDAEGEKAPVYEMNREKLLRGADLLKQAAQSITRDPEVYSLLVTALQETEQVTKENVKYIKHVYEMYPQSFEIRRQYGDYLVEDDDYDVACEVLRPLYHTGNDLETVKELRKIIMEFPNQEETCPLGGYRPMEIEDMKKNADK
jgi:hypothetical protein